MNDENVNVKRLLNKLLWNSFVVLAILANKMHISCKDGKSKKKNKTENRIVLHFM